MGPARGAAPALPTRNRQRRGAQCSALDPAAADALHAAAASLPHAMLSHGAISQLSEMSQHLSLAYERVTLPCSSMNCGDAIYRRCAAPPFQTVSSILLQQRHRLCARQCCDLLDTSCFHLRWQRCLHAAVTETRAVTRKAAILQNKRTRAVNSNIYFVKCSTLDPALRMEQKLFPDWRGVVLLGTGLLYLLSTPGGLAASLPLRLLDKLCPATCRRFGLTRP